MKDEEGGISDDPYLSAVNKDLESVDKLNDNKLLVVLLILVPLVFLYEGTGTKNMWLDAALVVLVVGYIAYTIFKVIREKKKVAEKHGLVCPTCGYTPKVFYILSAATTLRCAKCGAKLNC